MFKVAHVTSAKGLYGYTLAKQYGRRLQRTDPTPQLKATGTKCRHWPRLIEM